MTVASSALVIYEETSPLLCTFLLKAGSWSSVVTLQKYLCYVFNDTNFIPPHRPSSVLSSCERHPPTADFFSCERDKISNVPDRVKQKVSAALLKRTFSKSCCLCSLYPRGDWWADIAAGEIYSHRFIFSPFLFIFLKSNLSATAGDISDDTASNKNLG